jgi:hypothetical protein
MFDEATAPISARRGGFKPSAKRLRRAGPNDRTSLRASPVSSSAAPHSPVYWHGELPPLDAEPIGEYTLEAASVRVPHTLAHADELWNSCYEDLMLQASNRLEQEIARLGGHYAHVLDEHVESKYSGATGEGWLHGRFRYVLCR